MPDDANKHTINTVDELADLMDDYSRRGVEYPPLLASDGYPYRADDLHQHALGRAWNPLPATVLVPAPATGDDFSEAVLAERMRHTSKGYDDAHDREHGVVHLLDWAMDYAKRGEHIKAMSLVVAAKDMLPATVLVPAPAPTGTEWEAVSEILEAWGGFNSSAEFVMLLDSIMAALSATRPATVSADVFKDMHEAYRQEWAEADAEGDEGNRSRRALIAALGLAGIEVQS